MRLRATLLASPAALLLSAPASHATVFSFTATLAGALEVMPNGSLGTGFATIDVDDVADTMDVNVSFSGLTGITTASHIHCCTAVAGTGGAAVATTTPFFPGFPIGVKAGSYSHVFDLTDAASYNPSFVTANTDVAGAEAALLTGMLDGKAYFNIHSDVYPGGEIRGFLNQVPEPTTLLLLGSGLCLAGLRARRHQS